MMIMVQLMVGKRLRSGIGGREARGPGKGG